MSEIIEKHLNKELLEKDIRIRFHRLCYAAQKDLKKTAEGFKFKYANLPSVLDFINSCAIKEFGICVSQSTKHDSENKVFLITKVMDVETGIVINEVILPIPQVHEMSGSKENIFQKFGSAITYFRRYSIYIALNILPSDEDDDAGMFNVKGATIKKAE